MMTGLSLFSDAPRIVYDRTSWGWCCVNGGVVCIILKAPRSFGTSGLLAWWHSTTFQKTWILRITAMRTQKLTFWKLHVQNTGLWPTTTSRMCLRHIPILQSLPPQTFHTPVWNQPSYNIYLHTFNRYVTISTTTLPSIKLFLYYRIIFIIYIFITGYIQTAKNNTNTNLMWFWPCIVVNMWK